MKSLRTSLSLLLVAASMSVGAAAAADLEPGKSTAQEVIAEMGKPAMEVKRPNGEQLLYFEKYPWVRSVKVATIGPDGKLRGIEERLTKENIYRIKAGMREQEVRELLGPPREITANKRLKTTEWEYPWLEAAKEKRIFWVSFNAEGVVVKTVEMHDEVAEPTSD
jgi:outer membrane protein assembly factor BamE (lipoprotein component of BamABCDE complex)